VQDGPAGADISARRPKHPAQRPLPAMGVYVTGDGEYRVFEHTKAKKQGT
jgi:hypothetical protein